jgi:uncharacterized protein
VGVFSLDSSFGVLAIGGTFLIAGFVKGAIGMGLPALAMGLLGVVMAPAQAAAILVVPSLVTNVWQLVAGPSFLALIRRLWVMMAGVCIGTWIGAGLLTGGNSRRVAIALGVVLLLYGCVGLAAVRIRVPTGAELWLSPVIGVTTGFLTGATGVFSIPAVPYMEALGLEKENLVQALGLSFTVSTVALGLSLAGGGVLQLSVAGAASLGLASALVGMLLGQWLRIRISADTFRRAFFLGLIVLGGYLALRNVT